MPSFKPAYLIHGDDHGRIGERRAKLRQLAEAESGAAGLELLEGEAATPDAAAAALSAMTFALGRRFIVVDGAERWKDKDLDALIAAMSPVPDETTVTFFAREEGRLKTPARLHEAVREAGGNVSAVEGVKPWELPKWAIERARELGLTLAPDAARVLVAHVGDRQQRLLRELEKLSLMFADGKPIEVGHVEAAVAGSTERKAWSLADALVSGDASAATRLYLALRAQGERVPGLLYWISSRLRLAHEVAGALDRGEAVAQVRRGLRMPQRAASALIDSARERGEERLRLAIEELSDLELASRGGGSGAAAEDTAALLAIQRIAG